MNLCAPFAAITLLSALFARSVAAQPERLSGRDTSRFALTIVGGVSQFDLSGTGTETIGGAHLEGRLKHWLVGDASLRVFKPDEQFREASWYKIPEVQLQLQTPRGAVRPYLGAGGGWFIGAQRRGTASGALGLRYSPRAIPLVARSELRVRGIGRSFGGATAEWTFGVGYRF